MNWSRFFAIGLLLLALFLAVLGYSAWSSGEPYLRLLGLIMAGGAVVLPFIALGLYSRGKPSVDGEAGSFRERFRKLILLVITLYALGVPLYAVLVSGKMPTLSLHDKRMISQKAEPQSFWLMGGLHAVPGLYCLFLLLRRRT
jgi:hypothetical protein